MIPVSINYIPQYEAVLPTRIQWDVDDCTNCAVATAMELRGILTGQPVTQLSQLFLDWLQHVGTYVNPPFTPSYGGNCQAAARQAQMTGVCREYLWPISLIGTNDYEQMRAVVNLAPSPPCFSDAPNHKITDWAPIPYASNRATVIANVQSLLAAGYPITAVILPGSSHVVCVAGYDQNGCFTIDSHAWPQEVYRPWDQISPDIVVRSVKFQVPTQVAVTSAQLLSLQQLAAQFPTIVGSA